MSKVLIDDWVWDAIVEHYSTIREPVEADKQVMRYIIDKESRRQDRADYLDSRARYARLRDWKGSSEQ